VKFILFTWVSPEGDARWNAMTRESAVTSTAPSGSRATALDHGRRGVGRSAQLPRRAAKSRRAALATDGPFIETKEWVGGFIVVDARPGAVEAMATERPRLPRPRCRGRPDWGDGPLSCPGPDHEPLPGEGLSIKAIPRLVACPTAARSFRLDGPTHAYIGGNPGCWAAWASCRRAPTRTLPGGSQAAGRRRLRGAAPRCRRTPPAPVGLGRLVRPP
jgi:hypothetical protein